jgi:hypothetical protein
MKKITLVLCFSIVGFMGYSQQSVQEEKDISNQENVLIINVGTMDFMDAADLELLTSNDFKEINFGPSSFENNTHELVHRSSNENNLENKFTEGAFSYNEYVLNFEVKNIVLKKLKF